jgi:hypothetical protein
MSHMILVYAGSILSLILLGFAFSYSSINTIIRIHRTTTYNINALLFEGQVEVAGKAGGKTLISPITQRACICWRASIWTRGKHARQVYHDESIEPFDLNDGTGTIHIVPAGAKFVEIDRAAPYTRPMSLELDYRYPQIYDAVKRLWIDDPHLFGPASDFSVYEQIVKVDEQIYVLGNIKDKNGLKTMESEGDDPLIISGRSNRETLRTLYGYIAWNFFLTFLIGGLVLWMYVFNRGE